MTRALGPVVVVCALAVLPSPAQDPPVHRLEELTWPRIDKLNRDRTLFILPIGMLEEHGPHLPIGSDTFGVVFEAEGVARHVRQVLKDWQVVLMPPINYGQGGANVIANDLIHPGTYSIRQSTLRALVADLGAQVAQNGFKWIFVLTGHAAPTHNIAINDASDFVSESYGATMVHVTAVFRADAAIQAEAARIAARHFSAADIASFGLDIHAGVAETSINLALRPELVDPAYSTLATLAGRTRADLQKIASAPGWPGYMSAPAKASAAYGRDLEAWWVSGLSSLVLRAVGGEDLRKASRAPDKIDPALAAVLENAIADERVFEARLAAWLARR